MLVFVNGRRVELTPGMRVRHALTQEGLLHRVFDGEKVFDEEGNEVELDGALREGYRLRIGSPEGV